MAFVNALDAATPADTDFAKFGALEIRTKTGAVRERLSSFFTNIDTDPLEAKDGALLGNVSTKTLLPRIDNTYALGSASFRYVNVFATNFTGGTYIVGASSNVAWVGRSIISSPADGNLLLTNTAGSGFGGLQFGGTSAAFPMIFKDTGALLNFRTADNSAYASIIVGQIDANAGLNVNVGTFNVGAPTKFTVSASTGAAISASTITGTRHIGGTDIAGAIAQGVFTDGTVPAVNGYIAANVLGLLVSRSSALTSGTTVTSEIYHVQTAANSTGSHISHFAYVNAAHTTGTMNILVATVGSVEATGNGGTTTTLECFRTQALIGTGHTVTGLSLIDIRSPSGAGTVGTLTALDIQAMTFGSTNNAIRTVSGRIIFGGLPASSPGVTGQLWNNSGVVNIS